MLSTLVLLLHYILKCNYFGLTTVSVFFFWSKLSFLMRNYFPKRTSGESLLTLSKLYDIPVGFVTPLPSFEAMYCYICGRGRVAVARYRMICLVFVNFEIATSF